MKRDVWDRLKATGVVQDNGSNRIFPHRAPVTKFDPPIDVRFGAFLSWPFGSLYTPIAHLIADLLEALPLDRQQSIDLIDMDLQAAGHACIDQYFIAHPVSIASDILPFAKLICGHFYYTSFEPDGQPGMTQSYDDFIVGEGLDLYDHSPPHRQKPMESIYPIAATESNFRRFVAQPESTLQRLDPILSQPLLREELIILLLSDNSD